MQDGGVTIATPPSDDKYRPSELAGGRHHNLGQGGVSVDAVSQTVNSDISVHRHHHLLNEVGSVSTHDVATHDFARLSVDNHLD